MPATATARKLVTELATTLGAAVVYSINGANAVDRDNPYLYGYLGFGAMTLPEAYGAGSTKRLF